MNIVIPILQLSFTETNWYKVSSESDAFGYTLIEPPKEIWGKNIDKHSTVKSKTTDEGIVLGGGGYLTTEEAKHILNSLPLEITYVDKHSLFKYYNETAHPSEMMLPRTPSSIGRNVAHCHPPKSLKKVMTLMRELSTGKSKSESMWFKMGDRYVHITYKAIFSDDGEFLGILEYVQDIQPFFELPSEVKRGLSKLDEEDTS
mgnify:CR=1 FL=1